MLKTGLFEISLSAVIAVGGLSACSNSAQTPMAGMNHDRGHMQGMNHSTMDLGSADANFDLRFIDAMTPHHQGAVEMAKEAQQKSKRPEIKTLSADIIKAQDKEITEMKQWRQAWYPKASNTPMSPEQMKGMMMKMDLGAADDQFDLRFINAMIPHHESAVTMAKDALSKSKRPEIKQLAQDIVASQESEMTQMQQWRNGWYNQ